MQGRPWGGLPGLHRGAERWLQPGWGLHRALALTAGTYERDWFGQCSTADIVYGIRAVCAYTSPDECAADSTCELDASLPVEYGMCRPRIDLLWALLSGSVRRTTRAPAHDCDCSNESRPVASS
jgi:hypothetical protein